MKNLFYVGVTILATVLPNDEIQGITILKPPMKPIDKEEALNLAAWIVALVNDDRLFNLMLKEIRE